MSQKFYRIGENLNVVTKIYGQAMKDRDPKPLQELAIKEAEKGVDVIDVNIGPARKGGEGSPRQGPFPAPRRFNERQDHGETVREDVGQCERAGDIRCGAQEGHAAG